MLKTCYTQLHEGFVCRYFTPSVVHQYYFCTCVLLWIFIHTFLMRLCIFERNVMQTVSNRSIFIFVSQWLSQIGWSKRFVGVWTNYNGICTTSHIVVLALYRMSTANRTWPIPESEYFVCPVWIYIALRRISV